MSFAQTASVSANVTVKRCCNVQVIMGLVMSVADVEAIRTVLYRIRRGNR